MQSGRASWTAPSTRPEFRIVLGQRAAWPELLSRTRETESLGFDGLLLVDHFYGLFDVMDPTHEAYTMLAALAPFTQQMRLGVLVCGNTYRNPAFLLKQAITVDHISGGRVDFGVGAGWTEREHEAYGWEYPSAKIRVDRFAEALEIWELFQREERTTFEGEHYQIIDAPFEPKSLQQRMPLLIGGSGPRMLRLSARYADIWNAVGTPEDLATINQRLDAACEAEGRDPATLVRTVSPRINLLESARAFAHGVASYQAIGFRDIYLPWPRTEREVPVMREVARYVLPTLRDEPTTVASARPEPLIADLSHVEAATLAAAYAAVADGTPRQLLEALIAHPDERFDAAALREQLGLARHDEVARGFAAVAHALAQSGLARPWNEGQAGFLLAPEWAEAFTQTRSA